MFVRIPKLYGFGIVLLFYIFPFPLTGIAQPIKESSNIRKLVYTVEPFTQGESNRLRIGLTFQGDSSGKTRLILPLEWSKGVQLYRAIRNIKPLSGDVKIEDTDEPHVKIVRHKPDKSVSISYEVLTQPPGTPLTHTVYHYPVLRSSYFYVIGQALWVYPDMPETNSLHVSLQWKNIPDSWTLINSFGINKRQQAINATLEEFRAGTFLAGDYRVKKIVVNKQPVYAVTRGQWGFSDDEFYNCLEQIMQVERDFWNTNDFPFYMVALMPTDDPSDTTGGERRTNSFSLYLPKTLTSLSDFLPLLAHEFFHSWNPRRLGDYENDRLYWFGEGFTDYYAPLMLLRAGLISLEDYLASYNSLMKDYYASPVRSLTADEMVQKRQTDYDAERLFYQRGALLGYHWNATIRSKTNGKYSLDDVMHGLLKSAKPSGFKLSEKRIADAVRPYLGEAGEGDIEKYIDRGDLPLVENPFDVCAVEEIIDYRPFDAGFDFRTSFESRVISDVVPDSNAYRAGLRDGQKWITGGIESGNPTRLTKLTVKEGDEEKVVEYYPTAGEPIRLPQYKLKPGLSDTERTKCLSQFGVPSANKKRRAK